MTNRRTHTHTNPPDRTEMLPWNFSTPHRQEWTCRWFLIRTKICWSAPPFAWTGQGARSATTKRPWRRLPLGSLAMTSGRCSQGRIVAAGYLCSWLLPCGLSSSFSAWVFSRLELRPWFLDYPTHQHQHTIQYYSPFLPSHGQSVRVVRLWPKTIR